VPGDQRRRSSGGTTSGETGTGRPQRPIPDDDRCPEAEFARELRRLCESAGNPTLGVLARRTGHSDTTGHPSLAVVLALVTALGGDGAVWAARVVLLTGPTGASAPAPAALTADDEDAPRAVAVAPLPSTAPAPEPTGNVAPRRGSRRPQVLAAVAAAVVAVFLLADRAADEDSVTVTVQDLVTAGAQNSVEDTPAHPSTVPRNACRARGCPAPGPDPITGDRLLVVCQTTGERTTNGNDGDPADDGIPLLDDSRLWYGARLADGSIGHLSEIWLDPLDRGGLGLSRCL
jgi:hypothetical protein